MSVLIFNAKHFERSEPGPSPDRQRESTSAFSCLPALWSPDLTCSPAALPAISGTPAAHITVGQDAQLSAFATFLARCGSLCPIWEDHGNVEQAFTLALLRHLQHSLRERPAREDQAMAQRVSAAQYVWLDPRKTGVGVGWGGPGQRP